MTATEAGLSQTDFQLKRVAGCIAILQALAWIIMSLISIGLFLRHEYPDLNGDSYMDQVQAMIYAMFIYRDGLEFPRQAFRPTVFFAFMWVHLVVNIMWFLISVFVLRNTNQNQTSKNMKIWSESTVVVCGLDLITVIILGSDYSNCLKTDPSEETEVICANAILPVLVIAAKGFVLWFVNIAFAYKLYRLSRETMVTGQVYQGYTTSPQPLYMPQVRPQNFNTPGSPYPQQQQMFQNFNTLESQYQPRQPEGLTNFDTSRSAYQPNQQRVSQNFQAPGSAYQPYQQQVSQNFQTPGSPYQSHQQQVSQNINSPGSPYRRYQ